MWLRNLRAVGGRADVMMEELAGSQLATCEPLHPRRYKKRKRYIDFLVFVVMSALSLVYKPKPCLFNCLSCVVCIETDSRYS